MKKHRISFDELRHVSLEDLLERLQGASVILLTHEEATVGALLGTETLQHVHRELELLRNLSLGELESAGGAGHSLAEVLRDCELLLDEN